MFCIRFKSGQPMHMAALHGIVSPTRLESGSAQFQRPVCGAFAADGQRRNEFMGSALRNDFKAEQIETQ
jgi:hypothetical protein